MIFYTRLVIAAKAASIHFLASLLVAFSSSILVFGFWYPFPYYELSGGRNLFLLIVFVDMVCGPLLTLVLFTPTKPRVELVRDLGFVALIQLVALGYGLHAVWEARPLFLAQDKDRFKVVMATDLDKVTLNKLKLVVVPGFFSGPVTVALRESATLEEKNKVLFDALRGGRDYAERPEFYLPYDKDTALKSLKSAKPLAVFLKRWPGQKKAAEKIAIDKKIDLDQFFYLPVVARQDWIAVLDKQGQIQGFLKGDGF